MRTVHGRRRGRWLWFALLLPGLAGLGTAPDPPPLATTCIVSCRPGEGPGQYFYFVGAGNNLWPRCFAIDPNTGAFYIPEVDFHGNIRIHKFDRRGKFVALLKPEGRALDITAIAVSLKGDFYLVPERLSSSAGGCICRYDCQGRLLNRFGPAGPLTPQDLASEKQVREPLSGVPLHPEKYFHTLWYRFYLLPDDELLVVEEDMERPPETFRFYGPRGQLREHVPENRHLPGEVARERATRWKMWETLSRAVRKQKELECVAYSLVGPDGDFYFMTLRPDRLEIRRTSLDKPWTRPRAS